jgi:hypothetical protein
MEEKAAGAEVEKEEVIGAPRRRYVRVLERDDAMSVMYT